MTDTSKYKSVCVKHSTDNQLKDLSAVSEIPVSKSAMISHLVDKEWKQKVLNFKPKKVGFFAGLFSRSSSEVKSNDN
tara:strand:- start:10 stop:240 length:231 start_codon:yes stop_codon:yes gene_type:complete